MMSPTRLLAVAAGAAALLAAVAEPPRSVSTGQVQRITAIQLAQWIRAQRGVHVLDVRAPAEFVEFAIPTAIHAAPGELRTFPLAQADTVVVYAASDSAAAQAVLLLREQALEHVYVLSGGAYSWLADLLNATLPERATAEQERAFADVAELSRYFGGVPRRGGPAGEPPDPVGSRSDAPHRAADAARQVLRRGC